ncbi:LPXTG cell wall anchor domain-containing protein [Kitasatospora sp. NPDC051914]|uniref:LPXTG cell wall anchor domain-containing protein n=1 Tax=Kitasatospora sp. NPDC051914 TaxID=3154945 RepID=UPI00341D8759
MPRTTTLRAAAAVAAGLMALATGAPALAAGSDTYTVSVHQTLPVTAAGFGEHEKTCAGISASKDGWHFVLPGSSTDFVKLTVAFDNGAPVVVTAFGPPSDKHAYVASAPGAKLTSAVAQVKGGEVEWFNLSHTCPATTTPSSPAPSTSASSSTSASPSPSQSQSTSASPSPSGSQSTSTSASPSSGSPSAPSTGSSSASVGPSSASPTGSGPGGLASTGANVVLPVLAGLGLVAAGGVLVMRRKSPRH